jgi:hypothetical protein
MLESVTQLTLTGSGTSAALAGGLFRSIVQNFGRSLAIDTVEPIRYMELGWIAGYEQFNNGDLLTDGHYIGPLHWLMFERQTILLGSEFGGGTYDGIAWHLWPDVQVTIDF